MGGARCQLAGDDVNTNGLGPASVPSGLSGVVQISAGGYHTCALKNSGDIACWGAYAGFICGRNM